MSRNVLYGIPSEYDKTRDRENKPHAFFYFEAQAGPRYEAVINVESREGGEPANDLFFRVLVSDKNLGAEEALYKPDVEVATPKQLEVVANLLEQVQTAATATEPNLVRFQNQFNYQQLWTDDEVVTNWLTHPHQGDNGLFELLQSIYDRYHKAKRWYFIGKKFSQRGLDLVHMNAGLGTPDGLLLIHVEEAKWVAVFFAFQVDFPTKESEPGPFRPHPSLSADIEIVNVNYNPPGPDAGKESVTLRNNRDSAVNLKGWKVTATRGGIERRYVLPPLTLPAKEDLEIFVEKELFPNKGATVTLRDLSDRIVAATEY